MELKQRLTQTVRFSEADTLHYQEKGVALIKAFFTPAVILELKDAVEENFRPSDQPEGVIQTFDRFSNDFARRDERFRRLAEEILDPLHRLSGDELAVTQIAILELEAGKGKGFNWHCDEYSFSFIDPDDPGHTLWVPLNPIEVEAQHGGMCWVHQNDYSAKSRLKQWVYFQMAEAADKMPGGQLSEAKHKQFTTGWVGDYDKMMLEDLKKDCSLEIGDALLFNRYTWHKSQELKVEGPLERRTTIIFRLAGLDATINKSLFEKTSERMALEGRTPPRSFGQRLEAFKDGDSMRDVIASGISF